MEHPQPRAVSAPHLEGRVGRRNKAAHRDRDPPLLVRGADGNHAATYRGRWPQSNSAAAIAASRPRRRTRLPRSPTASRPEAGPETAGQAQPFGGTNASVAYPFWPQGTTGTVSSPPAQYGIRLALIQRGRDCSVQLPSSNPWPWPSVFRCPASPRASRSPFGLHSATSSMYMVFG